MDEKQVTDPGDRPERAPWFVLFLWAIVAVLLGVGYTAIPASPDQALFDYIGWRVLEGDAPYAEVVELNWPGAIGLHAAATAIFGTTWQSWRLFDYGWLLLSLIGIVAALWRPLGRRGAVAVGILYHVLYVTSGSWFAGQRDIVAAPLLFLAAALQLRAVARGTFAPQIAGGAAIGAAMLIKPTLGAMAAMLGAWLVGLWLARRIAFTRGLALGGGLAIGVLSTLGATAGAAAAWGVLDDWYEMCIAFNQVVYTQESADYAAMAKRLGTFAATSWHWVIAYATLGVAVVLVTKRRFALGCALCLFGTTAVSAFVQQKGFGYHLGPTLLGLALLAGALLGEAWRAIDAPNAATWRRLAGAAIVVLALGGLGKKAYGAFYDVAKWTMHKTTREQVLGAFGGGDPGLKMAHVHAAADHVRQNSGPGDTVLLWGHAVHVNYLAERASPTRFCHAYMLAAAREAWDKSAAWTEEFRRDLAERPPAFIVLTKTPEGGHVWIDDDTARAPSVAVMLDTLERDYRLETTIGPLELHRRR